MMSNSVLAEVYTPPGSILASFQLRYAARGVDFARFSWVTSERPPSAVGDEAIVLEATLETLESTFDSSWSWVCDALGSGLCRRDVGSDDRSLSLPEGSRFVPWTLGWRRIKLDANLDQSPLGVRGSEIAPGCALLFMAAQHRDVIRTLSAPRYSGPRIKGFWLPGLRCTPPMGFLWSETPWALIQASGGISLQQAPANFSKSGITVPVFVE